MYRCLTLKADVFPVRPIARTVQPAANQPLINGLEDTHVDCLAVVHVAYRKTHTHTNKQQRKTLRGFTPGGMITQTGPPTHTHTLTLRDGEDQISLLQEFPVQPWRSEEEVCDRGQTCPANGWLDVLLQIGVEEHNTALKL